MADKSHQQYVLMHKNVPVADLELSPVDDLSADVTEDVSYSGTKTEDEDLEQ